MRPVEPLETRRLLASFTASSVAELVADINAANAAGGSNTITLAPGAAFNLVAADGNTVGGTGLPAIAAGNSLAILGNGHVIQRSTAGSTPAFRLFAVDAGGSLALNNLTLSGGLSGWGGGIFNRGELILDGVTIQNCIAQGQPGVAGRPLDLSGLGGGIYSVGALTVTNSSIRNNQAIGGKGSDADTRFYPGPGGAGSGGGVYVGGGTATLADTTLSSNLAHGGAGGNGGKIRSFFGTHWSFVGGAPGGDGLGGGIHAASGTVTLRGNTLTGNAAAGGTGGNSPKGMSKAADGVGRGGGLSIAAPAFVSLDPFTQANTRSNSASTSDADIFGGFTILV